MNILDLDPQSFEVYLAESNPPPERRKFLLDAYQQRRSALAPGFEAIQQAEQEMADEGRRRLNVLPASVPEGMSFYDAVMAGEADFATPGMLTGSAESLMTAADMPAATLTGPTSQETMEDAAVEAAAAMIPGGVAVRAADEVAGATRAAIDDAQVAQAQWFVLKNTPRGTTGKAAVGKRMFMPSEFEDLMMKSAPTQDQQDFFLNKIETSRNMAAAGETDDSILEATGVLRLPIRNAEGDLQGVREMLMTDDQTPSLSNFGLRSTTDEPDVELVPQSELGPGVSGSFDGARIRVSEELDPVDAMKTAQHELGHFDHGKGVGILNEAEYAEVGADPQLELKPIRARVRMYRSQLKDPTMRDQWPEIQDKLKRAQAEETAFINYSNNPGEIAARLISNERTTPVMLSPSENLNPYLNANKSSFERGIGALRAYLRPDLNTPEPVLNALQSRPKLLRQVLKEPQRVRMPLDTSKGRVTDPNYRFSGRTEFIPGSSSVDPDDVPF